MIQYKNLISYLFAFLLLTYYSFNNTQVMLNGTIFQIILITMGFLFFLSLFIQTFTVKEITVYLLFFFLGIISYLNNHSTLFIILAFSLPVFRLSSIKQLLYFFIIYRSIFIFLIILLSLVGILTNDNRIIYKSNIVNAVNTYSLGFNHPNQLAQAVGTLLLIMFLLLLKNKNALLIKSFFGSIIIFLFYGLTRSRTFFICCTLALIVGIIQWFPFLGKITKWVKKGYIWVELIIILFGLILPGIFKNITSLPFINLLDQMTSGRLSFSASVFNNYPLTLFGTNFDNGFTELQHVYGLGKYAVDNGYIYFFFTYGLLGTIVYFVMLTISIKRLLSSKQYYFTWIILIISVWGLFENIVWLPMLNISLLLWAQVLSKNK
ncbi:hypothetical protein G8B20_05700 [Lactobacillus amylovorus]|uniref:hypothetical protein n=1 Tax=Lactobacillus amylovorus TaxID=1604 RepID=UPI001F5A28DE|nr:hypothetical protein [Lactobacillus amylovorus]UNL46185.1 hypothetical protein G8B20_05700 [Lactobacillus amylovorus]